MENSDNLSPYEYLGVVFSKLFGWDTMGWFKFASCERMERGGWLKRPAITGQSTWKDPNRRKAVPQVGSNYGFMMPLWLRPLSWRATGKKLIPRANAEDPHSPWQAIQGELTPVWVLFVSRPSTRCIYPAITSSIVQPDASGYCCFVPLMLLEPRGNRMVWLCFSNRRNFFK
jgi:hypothetical protein